MRYTVTPNTDDPDIVEMAQIREERLLSREQIGHEIGLTMTTIRHLELGLFKPRPATRQKIRAYVDRVRAEKLAAKKLATRGRR